MAYIEKWSESTLAEKRLRHDPTNSFHVDELRAIYALMDIPVQQWINLAKTGRADKEQVQEWINELDKVSPGYGKLFLGDMLLSEEEKLSKDWDRVPINWTKDEDGNFIPYVGDRNHSKEDYRDDQIKKALKESEQPFIGDLSLDTKEEKVENSKTWTPDAENLEFKTPEQKEAYIKMLEAKLEAEKAKLEYLKLVD